MSRHTKRKPKFFAHEQYPGIVATVQDGDVTSELADKLDKNMIPVVLWPYVDWLKEREVTTPDEIELWLVVRGWKEIKLDHDDN
jgi:hypothetical protein